MAYSSLATPTYLGTSKASKWYIGRLTEHIHTSVNNLGFYFVEEPESFHAAKVVINRPFVHAKSGLENVIALVLPFHSCLSNVTMSISLHVHMYILDIKCFCLD